MNIRLTLWSVISLFAVMLTACGASETKTLEPLASVYAEMAVNNQKMADAYQAVYKADRGQQQALMEKAQSIAKQVKADNEKLAEEAAKLGTELQGKPMKCEASESAGYTVGEATFKIVDAQPQLANIVISAPLQSGSPEKVYYQLVDSEGNSVYKSMGNCSDGSVSVNFRITINKGPQDAQLLAQAVKLVFVSESEYKGQPATAESSAASQSTQENDEVAEPEPAYIGDETNNTPAAAVTSEGVTFVKGANLKETLAKAKRIEWEYNADMGVGATVGKVFVTIPEDDLTKKGLDVIYALTSDIEIGIPFSVDYIKPSAKLQTFEVNE